MPKAQEDLTNIFMQMNDAFHHIKDDEDIKEKIFAAFTLGATYTALEMIRVEAVYNQKIGFKSSGHPSIGLFNHLADTILGCSFASFETRMLEFITIDRSMSESEKEIFRRNQGR